MVKVLKRQLHIQPIIARCKVHFYLDKSVLTFHKSAVARSKFIKYKLMTTLHSFCKLLQSRLWYQYSF